jgi:uncharacterized membrane protein YhaH (DUF805 family)
MIANGKCLLFIVLLSPVLCAQVNIGLPTQPSPADCTSTPTVLPDGSLKLTDCKGATEVRKDMAIMPAANPSGAPALPDSADLQTRTKYQESLRASYEYQTYSYAHAKQTFDWQDRSGRLIFWMVMLLVLAGLVFSSIHFYVGLKRPPATSGKAPENADDATEFEATLQGIKLKSSVLGLAILSMSMVFFYMYLKFVYPITNITQ